MLSGKTVLLTGGTGSFGNAFIQRFIDTDVKKIIIFSRDEDKQDLMRNDYKNSKLKFVLGNVRDYDIVHDAMRGVDVVFHAAALKQVPSCDFAPLEAVKTNVMGTDNIIRAAIDHNVEHVVCLSTGKAVYPINAMGLSKALMEKVIINRARQIDEEEDVRTVLKYIRYSNVFATRGSAVNIFTKQIKEGKPVTLTHPEMRRSIMTVDEAVELALFAMENGESGDLFVYKARRTTLQNLAECLFEVYDAKCREIEVIGARHGEKMEETILSQDELVRAIDMGSFVRVPRDKRGLNYMSKENIENKRDDLNKETVRLEMRVPNLTLDDVRLMIDKNWVKECDLEDIKTPNDDNA